MRLEAAPRCSLCGSAGAVLYGGLADRLFGSGGAWTVYRCAEPHCGLLWLNPRPVREDIGKAYADYYTHAPKAAGQSRPRRAYDWLARGYAAGRFAPDLPSTPPAQRLAGWFLRLLPGKRAVVDYLAGHLMVPRHGRLLEIGCGSGDALSFMKSLGWETCGVDVDPAGAAAAQARGLDVRASVLEEQRFPSESFDAIVMNHVIEHLHEPLATLAECRRLLRRGGRLVLVTPNTSSLWHRMFGEAWMHLDPPRHLQLYSPAALRQLAASAGFDVRECRTSIRDANGVYLGSRAIRRAGRHRMEERVSRGARLLAAAMQLFEAAVHLVDRQAGEEIVVIAERPDK